MSTTVTYKGNTIATVSNQTKTLKTQGKYMEGDVTLTDVSQAAPNLQAKTNIAPTTSSQTITADSGYDGLSSVQINAMPSGSATTPATTITAPPTLSVANATGIVTASISKTQGVTPSVSAGYVASGTEGTITVSGSNTLQLNTQAATTITPTTSVQTAVASGKFTTGAVTVAAMPTGTAGTPTATKGTVSNHAVTVTPSVTNTTGYITGGTKTGTGVSVSASELVSGTKSITENGTGIDVTNYASVDVNVSGGGGGTTAVTWTGSYNHIFYLDGSGTAQHISTNGSNITIDCLSGSIFTLFRPTNEPGVPTPTYLNGTLVGSIYNGARATYLYTDIVQAD